MACYQVNTMTMESFNLKSKEILIQVLKDLKMNPVEISPNIIKTVYGADFTFNLEKMQVEYPESRIDIFLKVKNMYSKKVIEIAAKKKNWRLKQLSENKYKATKF